MHTLDWDDLRIFLAVARAGGFVAAARRLGVDHTTVARRVNALEKALGVRLLNRSSRGGQLTDAGLGLVEHAERMEAEALGARGRFGAADQRLSGVVRLATPEAFGAYLAAPAVKRLYQRHPGIELELMPDSRAVNLTKREADVAITLARPTQSRLLARRLADYALGVYASRDYLERCGPIDHVEELGAHPLVWYIDDLIELPELRYLHQIAGAARPVFRSTSIVAQHAAVSSGLGLGVLHVFAAADDERLVRILPDQLTVRRSYWLVLHADQKDLPRIRAVAEFLHELARVAQAAQ